MSEISSSLSRLARLLWLKLFSTLEGDEQTFLTRLKFGDTGADLGRDEAAGCLRVVMLGEVHTPASILNGVEIETSDNVFKSTFLFGVEIISLDSSTVGCTNSGLDTGRGDHE